MVLAVPTLAVVVTPFVALAADLPLVGHGLPGTARSASGGVLAYLAAPRRRRLAAGLLVLASVRAMVGTFVAFFLRTPTPFHSAEPALAGSPSVR